MPPVARKKPPTRDVRVDIDRAERCGLPEAIYAPGKSDAQIAEAIGQLRAADQGVLVTRLDAERARSIRRTGAGRGLLWCEPAGALHSPLPEPRPSAPLVAIVTAGTSDVRAASEAALVCELASLPTTRLHDVGVAGLHRLLEQTEPLRRADIVIVAAGMDGALPSVVAGLVAAPVIALPTGVGYGAGLSGVAALLSMINACAAGLTVVNIDNGFGAGAAAVRIAQLRMRIPPPRSTT